MLDLPRGGRRLIGAGLAAGVAYLGAMALDLALVRNRTNDLRLLAGMVPGGERRWPLLGSALHLVNSVALAAVYDSLRERLPGSGWSRGLLFAQIENLVLYPLVLAIGRFHPAMKAGRLDSFAHPVPFIQEVVRHAAYGAVLGHLLERADTET